MKRTITVKPKTLAGKRKLGWFPRRKSAGGNEHFYENSSGNGQ